MALYIPHSIFHLARLLHVRPETFGPYYALYVRSFTLQGRTDEYRVYENNITVFWR